MAKATSPAEKKDARLKALASVVEEIQDKFGEGSIMKLREAAKVDVDAIPTGSISLDLALGIGGVPKGRIIEVFGPESSGKTTLALHIVANAQARGGLAAYVDAEHALDPEYAKKIGVKIDDLLISQPDTGEQALEIVEKLVQSGVMDVVVIDSVAALTPRAEIEGDMDQQHVGIQARLMSHALRKLTASISKSKTCVIFINQIRMKIGVMFGNPETTPGGKALKFYASVRIDIRRLAQLKRGEEVVGNRTKASVVKNKVAAPFRKAEFDILYNQGISYEGDLVTTGVIYGVVGKSGSWYTFGAEKLGQGMEGTRQLLKEDKALAGRVADAIKEKALAGPQFAAKATKGEE